MQNVQNEIAGEQRRFYEKHGFEGTKLVLGIRAYRFLNGIVGEYDPEDHNPRAIKKFNGMGILVDLNNEDFIKVLL